MLLWQLNLDLVNLSDLFLSALLLPRGPEAQHFQRDVLDKDRETASIHFLGILKLDCQMTQCTARSLVLSEGRSYCQCQWYPVHSRNSEYSGEEDKNQAVLLVYLMHFTWSLHMSDGLKTVYMQWYNSPVFHSYRFRFINLHFVQIPAASRIIPSNRWPITLLKASRCDFKVPVTVAYLIPMVCKAVLTL